jgi:hypothetical protein
MARTGGISLPLLNPTDCPVATLPPQSSCWYLSLSMDGLRHGWHLKGVASSLANSLSKSFVSVVCRISILDSGTGGTLVTCNGPEEQYNADEGEFGRGGEAD